MKPSSLEDHKISCEGIYTDILVTAGIDFRTAKSEYNDAISYGNEEESQEGSMLEQYSTDLTEKAVLWQIRSNDRARRRDGTPDADLMQKNKEQSMSDR